MRPPRAGGSAVASYQSHGDEGMSWFLILLTIAAAANGVLAGISVDTSAVKLPARHRIGAQAYATYARGADLGNGIAVYAAFGIGAALVTVIAAVLAASVRVGITGSPLPIYLAGILSLAHSFATSRAAPIMLSLRAAPNEEQLLAARLDRFARWQSLRAILQILCFFALLWGLVTIR